MQSIANRSFACEAIDNAALRSRRDRPGDRCQRDRSHSQPWTTRRRCGAISARSPGDHAVHSRYLACHETVRLDASDETLVSALRIVARRLGSGRTVLVPTTDRYSEFLSRNQDMPFRRTSCPVAPARSSVTHFLDKWKTAQLCIDNGILIPPTFCPDTTDELAKVAADVTFPVVVKPRYTFGTAFPGKNAVFVTNTRALLHFFDGNALLGNCVIQRIIPSGDGDILVTASYSADNGLVQAIYSGRKIRQYLPDYGATCFGISERHPELEEQITPISGRHRLQGFRCARVRAQPRGWARVFSRAEHANLLSQSTVCRCRR